MSYGCEISQNVVVRSVNVVGRKYTLCSYIFTVTYFEGILPKGPYLPCVSMAGWALWQDTLDLRCVKFCNCQAVILDTHNIFYQFVTCHSLYHINSVCTADAIIKNELCHVIKLTTWTVHELNPIYVYVLQYIYIYEYIQNWTYIYIYIYMELDFVTTVTSNVLAPSCARPLAGVMTEKLNILLQSNL